MEEKNYHAIIEAILFTMGESVVLDRIAEAIELDKKETKKILDEMMEHYNDASIGVQIMELDGSYQMCTKSEYHEYISRLAEPRRNQSLSNAAMEVLSIVAYKQPVTRSTIERIRGVSCDTLVNKLLERNLIEEVGRLDAPGRPMLFGTTDEFLRCFGIESVMSLPELSEEEDEELKALEGEELSETEEIPLIGEEDEDITGE